MKKDELNIFALGMVLGVLLIALFCLVLLFGLFFSFPTDVERKAYEAIEECEKSLPRDQSCEYVITARVKETK